MIRLLAALIPLIAFAPAAFAQKKKQLPPPEGAEFKLSPSAPKYVTCDLEFRDPKDEKWPNFFYGKPSAAGSFVWAAKGPSGGFAMTLDKMAQKSGDQDRKVLAEVLADGEFPVVSLSVKGFGATIAGKDSKGKPTDMFPVQAEVKVSEKAAKLAGIGSAKWNYAKDSEYPESVQITLTFPASGADLGLKNTGDVQITAFVTAFKELPSGKK